MKNSALVTILSFILVSAIFSQTPTPTPTPTDEDVVKISTTLIQVDVTVTDKKGKPVKNLKSEDFEIYENQTKQTISNFSFIETGNVLETQTNAAPKPQNAETKINAPLPLKTTQIKPENIRRTIAFVIDDLSLASDGIYFTRKALRNFVDKQMLDGDLIAIVRTGTGIGALQQFTSDKRQLYAAIENIRLNPYGSGGVFGSGNFGVGSPQPEANAIETESSKEEKNAESEYEDFRQSVFTVGTLGAVNYVVNGMQELPGRKSIVMISNNLSLRNSENRFVERRVTALKSLVEAANRASVVIYTMTATGMSLGGMFSAESGTAPNLDAPEEGGLSESQQKLQDDANAKLDESKNQDGLVRLARETGGVAINNKKETSANIQNILDDQKSYYLIGYQPNEETFDPKTARFNKLTVRVNRPDIIVRYRSGFFGLTDSQIEHNVKITASEKISNALTSPFAKNDINIRMSSLFGNTVSGSFVRSFLHIQGKDIVFTDEPDGWKKASFDVFAFIFGDNGLPVDRLTKTHSFRISPETYQQIYKSGFVYNLNMMVKTPGAYQFRIALRDKASEKVGSANQFIEVPDLKKKRLTISGITLEDYSFDEWQKSQQTAANKVEPAGLNKTQKDTALRQFKRGSILTFGYTIYNARLDNSQKPNLLAQIRLFRDGKLVLDGTPKQIDLANQKDMERISATGAISLVNQMQPGDYVLQIITTDTLKNSKAVQLVEFEVVE